MSSLIVRMLVALKEQIRESGLVPFGRFYSLYRAEVKVVDDGNDQNRIKVLVPAVSKTELKAWAYPVTPFAGADHGVSFPPEKNEFVWVMFEEGDPSFPVYIGQWYAKQELPTEFQATADPAVRGIKTRGGHLLLFDDTSGQKTITIQSAGGHKVVIDDTDGRVILNGTTASKGVVRADDMTEGHTHVVSGTAGPWTVSGTAQTAKDKVPVSNASSKVKAG